MQTGPRAELQTGAEVSLELLADETALSVLAALDQPRTAQEVAETCDVGLSTAYRKLETLAEAGLSEERVSVRSDGCRVSRYRRTVEQLQVIPGDGDVEVTATRRERVADRPSVPTGAASD